MYCHFFFKFIQWNGTTALTKNDDEEFYRNFNITSKNMYEAIWHFMATS